MMIGVKLLIGFVMLFLLTLIWAMCHPEDDKVEGYDDKGRKIS